MTVQTASVRTRSPWGWIAYIARRALSMEMAIWASLYRFLFRRRRVPRGAAGFSYHRQVSTILVVLIVLSALEVPIVVLIVQRWVPVRIGFLALGIWGVTWMIGLGLGYVTRPHAVGPEGIRVRNGAETDIALSWDDVHSVALHKQSDESKAPRLTTDDADRRTLWLRMQNETNIEIELERTVCMRLPSGEETADVVRLWVDEPKRFMDEVRKYL